MELENSKKKQVFAIVGVLLLIVLVIGVSYAMYTFTGTGTKENVITSGAVSIDYAEKTRIGLTNQYSESDNLGINSTDPNNEMQFTVSANITGVQTINYVLAFDAVTEGATLTDDYVKAYLLKDGVVATGFVANTGNTIASYAARTATTASATLADQYAILTDSFTTTGHHTYTLKAWVADNYDLPTTDTSADTTHSNTTTSETFTFKIKVVATVDAITIQ